MNFGMPLQILINYLFQNRLYQTRIRMSEAYSHYVPLRIDLDPSQNRSSGSEFIVSPVNAFENRRRAECFSDLHAKIQALEDLGFRVDQARVSRIGRPHLAVVP